MNRLIVTLCELLFGRLAAQSTAWARERKHTPRPTRKGQGR